MGSIRYLDAVAYALAKGGNQAEIDRQAALYARQVGSVPFNNMIRALNMMTWRNDASDWTRLAAALKARANARPKAAKKAKASRSLDTSFRDMPAPVRSRWALWCLDHDWAVSAGQNGSREFFVESPCGEISKFETPRELRNWAGY